MPNFKCKNIKNIKLPFKKNGVEFLWSAKNDNIELLFTKVENENFFLQIKKNKFEFVIKGDKNSKPNQIGYLQKALMVFKDEFCEEIINEAISLRNNRLLKKTSIIIKDLDQLLNILETKEKIYIEIGFGSGRHLLYQAQNNKDALVLGIEIYTPAIEQVAKLAIVKNLDNVLLMQNDARLLFSILKSKSVDKVFLHFPVPWDKKPHRRVISDNFCQECNRILKQNATFELRSDSYEYFEYTKECFLKIPNLSIKFYKNENLEISSKYEDRWKKQEKDIYDLIISNFNDEFLSNKKEDFDLNININNLEKIKNNFKNIKYKGDDFFVHFENYYIIDDKNLLLKIAFGAFYKPEHVYFVLSSDISFVFKKPFKTIENLNAFKEFKQMLLNMQIS